MEIPISVKNDEFLLHCLEIIKSGGRINLSDGLKLYNTTNLPALCSLANLVKRSRFGDNVFFNENLNYNRMKIVLYLTHYDNSNIIIKY